jgi:hypothetical protein
MADLPTRLRVGPFVYTVQLDLARLRDFEQTQGAPQHGYTDRFTCEIVLDPTEAPGQRRDTLWHEVKHAVAGMAGYQGNLPEEEVIARMSPLELLVLRDNPQLVAFLLEVDDAGDEQAGAEPHGQKSVQGASDSAGLVRERIA